MAKYLEVKVGEEVLCRLPVHERPYKNLHEYRVQCCHYRDSLIKDPNAWPCLHCGADGWVYHPDERPCPVEGWKGARRIKCPVCNGTQLGTKIQIEAAYKKEIDKWRKQAEEDRQRNNILACALSKLTEEEIGVLKECLGEFENTYYDKNPKIITLGVPCRGSCKTE